MVKKTTTSRKGLMGIGAIINAQIVNK